MPHPEHILIVDDDAEIRTLLRDYLERNGLRAMAVADGHGMRAALETGRFDLVVLDLMLPGEDGLTLCRELRARTITFPTRSARASCWRASRRCCAVRRRCRRCRTGPKRAICASPAGCSIS